LVLSRLDYGNAVLVGLPVHLYRQLVSHECRSMAHLQSMFLGPHLRCSSQPSLALFAWESDVQGWRADVQIHTWISTNTAESTGSYRGPTQTHIPLIWWFHPSDCLLSEGWAFPTAGPSIWNNLPDTVISAPTLSTFLQWLKTYLFSVSFSALYWTDRPYLIDNGS